jgi:hypothetical protein
VEWTIKARSFLGLDYPSSFEEAERIIAKYVDTS